MIRIEVMLSRDNMPVTTESMVNFMLVKLFPDTSEAVATLPLNLALVIDNSGSMYDQDKRITHAVDAACHVVDMLGPRDFVSVVAFSNSAKTFQQSVPVRDKDAIKAQIRAIMSWESGWTQMANGMDLACEEVRRNYSAERVNRVLLLTDGLTDAPERCESIARQETERGIAFSTFGVGHDWNQPLLSKIADLGRGRWYYIETPEAIPDIFRRELAGLQKVFANDVLLTTTLKGGVTVKQVRLVEPEIADVVIDRRGEREIVAKVGAMQQDEPVFLLYTLSLAPRKAGKYRIAEHLATFTAAGQRETTGSVKPLTVEVIYTTDREQLWQNGEVLKYVDVEHVDTMVRTGTFLIEKGDRDKGTRLLTAAANISGKIGDKRKTRLIQGALEELGESGQIDRKTQLSMSNQARVTSFMSAEEDDG